MKKDFKVPDSIRPLLDEVAERLWSNQATVMVGAGFSKNASTGFPDWNKLGDVFYEKIYGQKPDDKTKYLNVLKLADEVKAAFGRPALNQVLRESIPDLGHEPSPLHAELLDLPWTDVFTTNYDTLLERACVSVISRKYNVVINPKDLVYSEKPRIMKLHGDFRSEHLVITEDDYRRYPTDFAVFVNTVRQTLLESTLCLIGFSGDDPNFLQWTGWIRDNLDSDDFPKIYLIGIFNLSVARKKLLEQRNIVLIDMSECGDIRRDDHYRGLERFIGYLLSRKKDNGLRWPRGQNSAPADEFTNPGLGKDITDQIKKLLPEWRRQRFSYSGWEVLPEDLHSYLWIRTQPWINCVASGNDLPHFLDLEFAFELNWRMERCLCPIPDQQIEFFESVLNRYWHPEDWSDAEKDVVAMCIRLQLSVMRFYREEGLLEKWEAADEKIGRVFESMSPEQKAVCYYERSLFALFGLDMEKLRDRLEEWSADESLPFFEAKRASLLAETGQVQEAEKILGNSLKNIRARINLKPVKTDYSLVSQEAIIIVLLQYVQKARLSFEGKPWDRLEVWGEFSDRLNILKQYKCNPWDETKALRGRLSGPPVEASDFTEKQGFDIGRVTQTVNFRGFDEEALVAYRFLRFCEDAGIPLKMLNVSFEKEPTKGTLLRTYKYSPYWAMATLVRMGEQKAIDQIFNRESLARLDVKAVDSLVDKYLWALESSSKEIQKGRNFLPDNFGKALAKVLPEILSRLCCKCSLSYKHRLLLFLLEVYKSPYRENYDGNNKLMYRLLDSFTVRQRFDLIPKLLDFPFTESYELHAPNPFDFLDLDEKLIEGLAKPAISPERIDAFLEQGLLPDKSARQWAIFTLGQLHFLDLLTQEQRKRFAAVLWAKLDDTGLPDQAYNRLYYYKFGFTDLPHPDEVNPLSLFRDYIRGASLSEEAVCRNLVMARGRIEWSDEEIKSIFQKIVKCWDKEKSKLSMEDSMSVRFGSFGLYTRSKFEALVEVLVFVVAPNFNLDFSNKDRGELLRLIGEFSDYGLPTIRLKTACLRIYPDSSDQILDTIENGLSSSDVKTAIDSLGAVLTIIADYFDDKRNSQALPHLIDLLGQMIFWRKNAILPSTVKTIKEIAYVRPSLISGRFEKSILMGLGNIADDTSVDAKDRDYSGTLNTRKRASCLAYRLFKFYTDRKKAVPDAIKKWQDICRSDAEFAEIRNQWITDDQETPEHLDKKQ